MRVMFFGSKIIVQKLAASLRGREIEWVSPAEVPELIASLQHESFDLAIVDSQIEKARLACQHINESCTIPLVLMLRERPVNWEMLDSFDVDGYLPDWVREEELAARLQAVVRRQASAKQFGETNNLSLTFAPQSRVKAKRLNN